jgi:hypothetical protein
MIKQFFLILIFLSAFSSCVAVKEYEMVQINDPDMKLTQSNSAKSTSTFQSYREGAAGANGGKSGGGCGCN